MPSTSIRHFEYDEAARILSVWFVASGRRYDYRDVPPDVAGDFRRAFSKGRFFNARIRDRYPFVRVREERNNPPSPPLAAQSRGAGQ